MHKAITAVLKACPPNITQHFSPGQPQLMWPAYIRPTWQPHPHPHPHQMSLTASFLKYISYRMHNNPICDVKVFGERVSNLGPSERTFTPISPTRRRWHPCRRFIGIRGYTSIWGDRMATLIYKCYFEWGTTSSELTMLICLRASVQKIFSVLKSPIWERWFYF